MIVYEFNRSVSVVNRDPVGEWVPTVVSLVPGSSSFDLWGEVIGGSEWGLDERIIFWEYKCKASHDECCVGGTVCTRR